MNILKKILLMIIGALVLIFVTALFVDSEYAVVKEVQINKPKSVVFDYIKYLKNQDNYSVWAQIDPKMKKDYRGEDGTVGFVSVWDSENDDVGKGEQEIKKITEGERIDLELRFIRPFEATDNAYLATETINDNETKVKWGFNGSMAYPFNIMLLSWNMEEMVGKDLEEGLLKLKSILEQ